MSSSDEHRATGFTDDSSTTQTPKTAKMSSEGELVTPSEDVTKGEEPGASRNSLILSDSYEDLALYLEEQLKLPPRPRLASGTIKELKKLREESNRDDTSNDSLNVSSRDSSNRATPSKEFLLQESTAKGENGESGKKETVKCNNVNDSDRSTTNSLNLSEQESERSEEVGEHAETEIIQESQSSPDISIPQSNSSTDVALEQGKLLERSESLDEEELDYVHTREWRNKKKHVFILSDAGKPIYSRYGDEDKLVTIMGVMQALVSFVQDSKDLIRCICAGDHKFVFLVREHLILVGVVSSGESMHQILLQLNYLYNQVLSVLTYSQLSRIFKQRHNYDLRRLLTGAEKFFENLLNMMDFDASFLLSAVRCLPLESHIRDTISQSIAQHAKVKNLVFAILVMDNQLVTLVRMKRYFLHPLDLHLVFNLVSASESFKGAESWSPICLPKFDSGGYLHGHISYLDEASTACLLLLTVDRDMFFTLSECRQKILQRLNKYNCLKAMSDSLAHNKYNTSKVGIPELRHFLYKSRSTAQFTRPEFEAPYLTEEEQRRLFGLYQYMHHRIHSTSRPLKILFHVGQYETLLGWVTSGFELYAVFSPLVTKPVAISSINKLLKWIKKDEDKLFILTSPTF